LVHRGRINGTLDSRRSHPLTDSEKVYIGWSDVTYLWSQCDRHFVRQHVVLCVAKWWRFVALFQSNWISWFKKMSVLSLSYWESDVYWRQNNKRFAEFAPQNGGKQLIWRNYVTVTLCIERKIVWQIRIRKSHPVDRHKWALRHFLSN